MKKKILIIEDDFDNLTLFQMALHDDRYEILTATNGEEALIMAKKEVPDLIILDLMLPFLDGFEVNRSLKKNAATKDIPVIVVTAKNEARHQIDKEGIPIAAYFDKPIAIETLIEEVKKLIG